MRGTRAALSLVLCLAAMAGAAEPTSPSPPKSGVEFQSTDVQALQRDEFANPGMLWVARGERLWKEPPTQGPACASCHGDAQRSMRGVAASYPKHDAAIGAVVDLEGRIRACAAGQQKRTPPAHESEELLALAAYIAHQSSGMASVASIDGPAAATYERGRKLYFERQGQFNLACNQCHDRSWGGKLLGERISQGHPADWPAYRLEWQSLGSLQRRLRACYYGVRAEQPAFGSGDLVALELYIAARARGVASSPPGVRK
jgi:sulfur-oxidizing protein SoxA